MPRSARKKRKLAPASALPRAQSLGPRAAASSPGIGCPALAERGPAPAPTELAAPPPAPSRSRRGSQPWIWALASVPLLPPLTAHGLVWPSAPDAFLCAYAWALALCAPVGALRSSFARPDDAFSWIPGAFRGALAATPVACLLLWGAAIASLARAPQPVGGQLVDISCSELSCEAGLFDHEANRHLAFRLRPGSAPASTGSHRHMCLRPAWPAPVRGAWEDIYAGCSIPEQFEPDSARP